MLLSMTFLQMSRGDMKYEIRESSYKKAVLAELLLLSHKMDLLTESERSNLKFSIDYAKAQIEAERIRKRDEAYHKRMELIY